MTACPAGYDSGPDVPALIDCALQCNVEQVATGLHHQAEVAHGREAGFEGGARVHRAAQGAIDGVVLHAVHGVGQAVRTARPTDQQVELHVHQARQQRDVAEVDVRRIGRQLSRIHRLDALAVDDDHRRRMHLAGVDVGPALGAQDGQGFA